MSRSCHTEYEQRPQHGSATPILEEKFASTRDYVGLGGIDHRLQHYQGNGHPIHDQPQCKNLPADQELRHASVCVSAASLGISSARRRGATAAQPRLNRVRLEPSDRRSAASTTIRSATARTMNVSRLYEADPGELSHVVELRSTFWFHLDASTLLTKWRIGVWTRN